MAIVLVVIGILTGLAVPRLAGYVDRLAVRRASDETAAFFNRARIAAVYRAARLRVSFADDSLVAVAEGVSDSTVWRAPGPARYGVGLTASRYEIRLGVEYDF